MKILIGIVLIFLFSVISISGQTINEAETEGISFTWEIDEGLLHCTVRAETEGWIAVGFKPERAMKGANIIIGYVDKDSIILEDHYGTGTFSHSADTDLGGEKNLTIVQGTENKGITEIEFTIPLDSGDEKDTVLSSGEMISVILAYGKRDNLRSKHKSRGTVEITL